ncbi:hypothetical protein SAMN05421785_106257 [Chryseobacterium gambrini]|uniref:Uncharacterized protein n=2 Tax=Chryseobacterium gambrini TaxID=373672 RepID=A0A1N7PHS6_9FLAO|nr:hypothetical protein SAMN05421785_106257 [Chryseobacterium gambrini]
MKLKIFTILFLLCFFSVFSQNKFVRNYTLFSIVKNNDMSEIKPTKATVIYDYTSKKITINKLEDEKETYTIISKTQNSKNKAGENYLETIATDGNYNFLFRFSENRVMIINIITRNGLVLYK